MKTARSKRMWRNLVSMLLTFSLVIGIMGASADSNVRDDSWRAKISDELLVVMSEASRGDLIPVYLWLREIDESVIEAAVLEERGFDSAIYRDNERFNTEVAAVIEAEIVERFGHEAAHYSGIPVNANIRAVCNVRASAPRLSNSELEEFAFDEVDLEDFDWGLSLVQRAVSQRADEYMMARRGVVRREYTALNDSFVAANVSRGREIIYFSNFSSTMVVEATVAEIEAYARMDIVEDISLYVARFDEPAACRVLEQIGVSGTGGTKGSSFNGGAGYRGTGVVIGIIEAQGAQFDRNAPQLRNIPTNRLRIANNAGLNGASITPAPVTADHATMVTSIIVGQSVTVSGVTYEGVVPMATVIQTPIREPLDAQRAIQRLAEAGAHVINYSGGVRDGIEYSDYSREVDRLIRNTFVTFVTIAGNDGETFRNVWSPGRALDAITVGSVNTKNEDFVGSLLFPLYRVRPSSSFVHAAFLPNKPDVAAPGVVSYVRSVGVVDTAGGTSRAAPLVTGVIAQMMQVRADFRYEPDAVKAILLTGARHDLIMNSLSNPADSTNTFEGNFLWSRSGAGLVDAIRAVRIAESNRYRASVFRLNSMGERAFGIGSYNNGQRIRIVMTFMRSDNRTITQISHMDNIDIRLIAPNGAQVAISNSTRNNVEIIEYTIPSGGAGSYSVRVTPTLTQFPHVYYSLAWEVIT
jgi:hypothetical protein